MPNIAELLLKDAGPILDEIDRYIAKADDDLEKRLKQQGYKDAKNTVRQINDTSDALAENLSDQTNALQTALGKLDQDLPMSDNKVSSSIDAVISADTTSDAIAKTITKLYKKNAIKLATMYIEDTDPGLVVTELQHSTAAWMDTWGDQLSTWISDTTHGQIGNLVTQAVNDGLSVADTSRMILGGGWRDEYYQAQRISVTEMLRCHSVAQEEAIEQDPAVDRKEWVHSGAFKIEPRKNHVAINGQVVPATQPFTLIGADGTTYYPMFPRDPKLPPGESINCHCTHRGIVSDDILGMSLEDRQKLQQQILDERNADWDDDQDAKAQLAAEIARSRR